MSGGTQEYVRIVNKNDFTLDDRIDGVEFAFPPKKAVTVPMSVARHFFRYGADPATQKRYILMRYGYNTPAHQTSGAAAKFLSNLEFKPVRYRMVEQALEEAEVPQDEDDIPIPAPRLRRPLPPSVEVPAEAASE